jgi:uncharacterized protein YprB with RNaseH-like and TPR domain
MDDLFDKLKALGLKIEKAVDIEPLSATATPMDEAVSGRWLNELTRGVYIVEKVYPAGNGYGKVNLTLPLTTDPLEQFAESKKSLNPEKIIFLDTETSSLSTGAGSMVFMIGMSFFEKENLKTIQLFLDKPEYETDMLCYFDDLLKGFDTFISYNGKAFDIPMLRSRFILNRIPPKFNEFNHIDLLHVARRIWKVRLDSRRLSDIEKEIIEFTRGGEEIPGWLVPQIYFDYLASHDAQPLKGVFYHNEMDVVSLAALFIIVNRLLAQQEDPESIDGRDAFAIGSHYGKIGKMDLSRNFLKSGMEHDLPEELKKAAARNYAYTYKKQGKWDEAIEYWETAAGMEDFQACIELAMAYEHHKKDPQTALKWVERAFNLPDSQKYRQEELIKRKLRLIKKCEAGRER